MIVTANFMCMLRFYPPVGGRSSRITVFRPFFRRDRAQYRSIVLRNVLPHDGTLCGAGSCLNAARAGGHVSGGFGCLDHVGARPPRHPEDRQRLLPFCHFFFFGGTFFFGAAFLVAIKPPFGTLFLVGPSNLRSDGIQLRENRGPGHAGYH
jgi:hypothetical protein